ncbi:MAG: NAD(P)/FAD-dependent oxidoreductase [Chitinophagaceae bacterium]
MGFSIFNHLQKLISISTVIHIEQLKKTTPLHNSRDEYDVAIVGGGLSGLAIAIQLSALKYKVVLFEKEKYPFHKVCGEYISLESWDFLQSLGVDLDALHVSIITRLQISSVKGNLLEQFLPLGGFGISRYILDNKLVELARVNGVNVLENTKVNDVLFSGNQFYIDAGKQYSAKIVCGGYGKRSNIDIKWKRPFILTTKNKLNNYLGIKYHIKANFPDDTIALHNFDNGYCGIVKIEDDKYCLCYLTTAANLEKCKGNIKIMEDTILSKNPYLKQILHECERLYDVPLTISQISFEKKSQSENHVLMIGDAAGMITPLCGNGMSMALHGSKLAAKAIDSFLQKNISRREMEQQYTKHWKQQFGRRLKTGRQIQSLLGKGNITTLFIRLVKPFPTLINFLIRQTHGKTF